MDYFFRFALGLGWKNDECIVCETPNQRTFTEIKLNHHCCSKCSYFTTEGPLLRCKIRELPTLKRQELSKLIQKEYKDDEEPVKINQIFLNKVL
jgi:recombinational DNA repair protein (RecF pathway)